MTLRVKSSFAEPGKSEGTEVVAARDVAERRIVSGVAYMRDQARVSLHGIDPDTSMAGDIFSGLAEAGVGVDMIVQARSRQDGMVNLEFSVDRRDLPKAKQSISKGLSDRSGIIFETETDLAKVSVVGTGLRGRADVARTLYKVLGEDNIAVRMVATSEIKISALVESDLLEQAVRVLHAAYGLDKA